MVSRRSAVVDVASKFMVMDVPVADLVTTRWNPPVRRARFESLAKSLEDSGQFDDLLVVEMEDGSLEIADGNRRHRAASHLGWEHIRAKVFTGGMPVLKSIYSQANGEKFALRTKQETAAALLGGPAGKAASRCAVDLQEMFQAADERDWLVRMEVGSYLVSVAKRMAAYADSRGVAFAEAGEDRKALTKRAVVWLRERNMQQQAVAFMRQRYSAKRLRGAMDANRDSLPGFAKKARRAL